MFTAESIHAVQQPAQAPQTSVSNLATSLGAPQAAPQVAPQPAPQPVAATPRPTSINFAALAHNTVAMPAVDEVRTAEMNVVTDAPEKAPSAATNYASSRFDATAAAEEELVFTTTASLPETEEMPAVADMDTLSNGDYGTPAYTRQTMALQQSSTKEIRTPKYPEGSLMNNGVDYDMPAFLRMGGNEEF